MNVYLSNLVLAANKVHLLWTISFFLWSLDNIVCNMGMSMTAAIEFQRLLTGNLDRESGIVVPDYTVISDSSTILHGCGGGIMCDEAFRVPQDSLMTVNLMVDDCGYSSHSPYLY